MKYLSAVLHKNVFILILCIIAYFPTFLHLDTETIFLWDESRLAVNAAEMTANNNFLTPTYNLKPDMWNTKPPLMVWFQTIFMKTIGINELAVRLPSALALFILFFVLISHVNQQIKFPVFALIAGLSLITSDGFIAIHISRTGDYDALLTLFTTLYILCVYKAYEASGINQNRYLYLTFFFIILAFYTKTIQGLIFVPITGLFLIIKYKHSKLLWRIFLLAGITSCIGAGYYLLREQFNPGYIDASLYNDITGRYAGDVVSSKKWNYYINHLLSMKYSYAFYMLPITILYAFIKRKQPTGKYSIYLLINLIFYFVVIQFSKSKGLQYLAPVYPILAILFSITLYFIYTDVSERMEFVRKPLVIVLFMVLMFAPPYISIINKNLQPYNRQGWWSIMYGDYMKRITQNYPDITDIKVVHNGYNAHLDFYILKYGQKKDNFFNRVSVSEIKENDTVLFCGKGYLNEIGLCYKFEILDEFNDCYLIKVVKET